MRVIQTSTSSTPDFAHLQLIAGFREAWIGGDLVDALAAGPSQPVADLTGSHQMLSHAHDYRRTTSAIAMWAPRRRFAWKIIVGRTLHHANAH
jgi:hypothetical protein